METITQWLMDTMARLETMSDNELDDLISRLESAHKLLAEHKRNLTRAAPDAAGNPASSVSCDCGLCAGTNGTYFPPRG